MAQRSYKTECPKCGKDNFYVTPRNGMGYCFSPTCHYVERDGKAYTGKERVRSDNVDEIRALYYTAAHYYHSALNTQARNFLHARGFTDETIKRLLTACSCLISQGIFLEYRLIQLYSFRIEL